MKLLSKFKFRSRSPKRPIPESLRVAISGGDWKRSLAPIFAFYFDDRKIYLKSWFPDNDMYLMGLRVDRKMFNKIFKQDLLDNPKSEILTWGYRADRWVYDFAKEHCIPLTYCEDGFIRSTGLGNERQRPLSLCFDRQGLYFDATGPSDLETILKTYSFAEDVGLMQRARDCRERLLSSGLSKYNFAPEADVSSIYGIKSKRRVLVLGQVESDASIKYGYKGKIDNNDLVRLACSENPDSEIIYKPHPDVLYGSRQAVSNPDDVSNIAKVVKDPMPFSLALETIDHVYTITSLGGFEALLRGIPVTTVGCPFYSGWGLTDERQPNTRRGRNLTVDEVFAAAYILYPRYFHPIDNRPIELEEALEVMSSLKASRSAGKDATPSATEAVTG